MSKERKSKFFSLIFGKTALCGVVGNERKNRGFGKLPNKQKMQRILWKGTPFLCLLRFSLYQMRKDGKEMERKQEHKDNEFCQNAAILNTKRLLMKSAVHFMKYLRPAAVRNCFMTK